MLIVSISSFMKEKNHEDCEALFTFNCSRHKIMKCEIFLTKFLSDFFWENKVFL